MDNKYANLPGIAKNEPDVYETQTIVPNNLTIKSEPVEDESLNVQKINISTKEAHEKYNKKILSNNYADFSDNITNRRKFGFVFEPETFEWNQDPFENPLQRFRRLENELKELKSDIEEMEKENYNDETFKLANFQPTELLIEVDKLQRQINSLHLLSIGANEKPINLENKSKKEFLVDYINEIKKKLNETKGTSWTENSNQSTSQDSSIVFKLFADLEKSDIERSHRVADLNQRLSNLEKVFGAGNASVSEVQVAKLCTNIENKSILGLIENLNLRINLVDNQSIDLIESRLQSVSHRVNQLNEKKNSIEDHEKLNRVNELYNLLCKWKELSGELPSIVQRLSSLDQIHKKAFEFASMLSRLDKEQEGIKESVQRGIEALDKLRKQFETNIESTKADFEALSQRILSFEGKR